MQLRQNVFADFSGTDDTDWTEKEENESVASVPKL